jgi:hypothetical protein
MNNKKDKTTIKNIENFLIFVNTLKEAKRQPITAKGINSNILPILYLKYP